MSDAKQPLPTVGGPGGERCGECRWWESEQGEQGNGTCRRLPPVLLPQTVSFQARYSESDPHEWEQGFASAWGQPATHEHDWCGEFKARAGGVNVEASQGDVLAAVDAMSPLGREVAIWGLGIVCDTNPLGVRMPLPELAKKTKRTRDRVRQIKEKAAKFLADRVPGWKPGPPTP